MMSDETRKLELRARAIGFIVAAILLAILCAGCWDTRHMTAAVASKSRPYQEFLEDPVALTTIRTIAVFPFENRAPQSGFDSDAFANKLANHLASAGKVRVLYPKDILEFAEKENSRARLHNARLKERVRLGLYAPPGDDAQSDGGDSMATADDGMRPISYYEPVKNVDEAVKLARRAKADAIIMGEISDFDPYMRPRISLTMRVIATGNSDTAAKAIAELTQWGVPRPNSSAKGIIYIRQETFDSTVGSVGMDVSVYGRTHFIDNHAYDTEAYIRSMTLYYEVVTSHLAKSYVEARKKAVEEAERRAKAEAKRRNQDQDAAIRRIAAMMERDSRIPDFETDYYNENHFDQAFADKRAVIGGNNGDKRIQSWRPDGRTIRPATPVERQSRDARIPENERGQGLQGYSAMVDSTFPDADAMMEMNMGDNRDRGWRPDYYNHANPQKSTPLYGPEEYRGGR